MRRIGCNLRLLPTQKVGLKISLAGEGGGNGNGDWFAPGSWADGIVPHATHTAYIDADRDIVIDDRTYAITQNLAVGTADGAGRLTIKNGGKLQAGGSKPQHRKRGPEDDQDMER